MENIGRFRVAIGAVIENTKEEVLLIKRSDYGGWPGIWDIAGGGRIQFEEPLDTLSREIREETGITEFEVKSLIYVYSSEIDDVYNKDANVIGVIFWCKTSQKDVTLSHEHTEYIWIKPEKALEFVTHKDIIGSLESLLKEKARISKK